MKEYITTTGTAITVQKGHIEKGHGSISDKKAIINQPGVPCAIGIEITDR